MSEKLRNLKLGLITAGAITLASCGGSANNGENVQIPPTPIVQVHANIISSPDFLNNLPAESGRVTGPIRPAEIFGENVDCTQEKFPKPEIRPVNTNSTVRVLNTEADLSKMLRDTVFRGPRSIISSEESKLVFEVVSRDLSAILAIVHNNRSSYVVTANYICPTEPRFR